MKKISTILLLGLFILTLSFAAAAQDLSGEEVLTNIENARQAETASMQMTMELYNAAGDMRSRQLNSRHKEGEVEKSLIEFTSPADVAGTAFLSLEDNSSSEEDMYLFLPVLGSVRKISGSQKNGNFVGSDLSYIDLTVFSGANYKDNYQADVLDSSSEEYLLKLNPTDPDINYKYGKMWVKTDIWSPKKVEFYDQSEELLKTVQLEDFKKIDNNWIAQKITVKNEQKGTKTVMKMTEIKFNINLDDQLFTTRYLER
ncbi:outer membrane lipoprotein-sorting protein [Halanaerobium kushneri]|uniref:Outer membrane lipoprotein-sorting protein n=1 Tax=Halanaerobium kushneri TaxID=56779 RepID=A0A1N6ZK93_9FIRM|nr:outer membrane lipoprotein-sorting protein [Halanaerobium kushneri]SIR27312.1 outer membrane lipoprotein-sorting protein [Halanaerobium kushneri]